MSYASIKAGLITVLQSVSQLEQVYDYEEPILGSFPAATVTNRGHENVFGDTAANKRTYSFYVRLYAPTADAKNSSAETNLTAAADAVISAIESNLTLGGTCQFARPTSGSWGYTEREVPVRYVEIQVDCSTRVMR